MDNSQFFSIERLMEFGLSLAVSQQMIQAMNESIRQMYIPGSMASMPAPSVIYVALDGRAVGPMNDSEFVKLLETHQVTKETLVWMPGMLNWQPLEMVPAALKFVALTPPPVPTNE